MRRVIVILVMVISMLIPYDLAISDRVYEEIYKYRNLEIDISDVRKEFRYTHYEKLIKALDLIPDEDLDRVFSMQIISDENSISGADGWAMTNLSVYVRFSVLSADQYRVNTVVAHEIGHTQDFASGNALRNDEFVMSLTIYDVPHESLAGAYASYFTQDENYEIGKVFVEEVMPKYFTEKEDPR